ncbi:MAG TPA: patatin-like phospholipase family protein [Albitalea sp.]|uniref:patatin-like phospholipase family protein n=1 Tax=Piscinibacter sp. TaxID=1903157 RepID=UPI002ED195F7
MPTTPKKPRVALALAGGGPLGAIYEIGALCALDEALDGVSFADIDAYVGVSAGGFIAAGLANGMSPRELCASFIENAGPEHDIFEPSVLIRPAWGEIAKRLAALPVLAVQASTRYLFGRRSLSSAFERLGRALPAGLFSNAMIDVQLRRQFSVPGRTNDFRQLSRKLVLVATDLDSGDSAPFGQPGFDHVPISKAVQASAALPGLFPPVEIDGHHYVDGALKKTLHASVLLEEDVDLLICLNPLVPFNAKQGAGGGRIPKLVDGGLPVVLSQTFRTMIHSRLQLGMKGYERSHPDTTIVLFEPDQHDAEMFLANTFSYSQRRGLAEHAYQQTRRMLRERRASLGAQLARHGVTIRDAVLDDVSRTLVSKRPPRFARSRSGRALQRLEQVLDDLELALPQR